MRTQRRNGAPTDTFEERLAAIAKTSGGIKAQVERMCSVREIEDDPRLTIAILGWLHEARWPGSGTADGWAAMFERLIALRDAGAVAPLRQMANDLPPFLGAKHRAFIATELTRVADEIERATPRARTAKPIVVGAAFDPLAIVQRVFDAPNDDDVRRVVADELLEHGDPWGEFIQLGFLIHQGTASPDQKKLADKLARKNAAKFGGPLAKIAKVDSREFERGFLIRVLADASMVARPIWEAAATSPYWATVKRLEVDMVSVPKWWGPALVQNPALRHLRKLSFNRYAQPLISLERATEGAPWRVVEAKNIAEPWLRFLRGFVAALPEAERKRIEVAPIKRRDAILQAISEAR